MDPETLSGELALVRRHIDRACATVAGDGGASPILLAIVRELQRKAEKAAGLIAEAGTAREAVVELEEAADCARVAAQADTGAAEPTREAVDLAHQAMCVLKAEHGKS